MVSEEARILVEGLNKLLETPLPTLIVLAILGVIVLGFANVYALVVSVRSQSKQDKGEREVLMAVIGLFGGLNTSMEAITLALDSRNTMHKTNSEAIQANAIGIKAVRQKALDIEGNQDHILKAVRELKQQQADVLDKLEGNGESLGLIAMVQQLSTGVMTRMEQLSKYLPKEADDEEQSNSVPENTDSPGPGAVAEAKLIPRSGASRTTALSGDTLAGRVGEQLRADRDSAAAGDQPGTSP